jgi:spermidine synthase
MQKNTDTNPNPTEVFDARIIRFSSFFMAMTIFVSAYLLFQVQPLMSKLILPWFGGSPTVWTTAMLFFQIALFGGYVYSHAITRYISIKSQAVLHLLLLIAAALLSIFVIPDESFKPTGDENPVRHILWLLICCVGLPYFCLATTGPLIQYWFALAFRERSPYRLYSLSNIGSFFALLSFPYVFEPNFELRSIGWFWTSGFWVFAILEIVVIVQIMRSNIEPPVHNLSSVQSHAAFTSPSTWTRLLWVGLPALASMTLIAATDHVSHDVAPEPRIWVFTLCLYLLTFIICFDHPRWYCRRIAAFCTVFAILLLSGRKVIPDWFGLEIEFGVSELRWSSFATMFLICFVCHGELVRLRPKTSQHLTEFYMNMSFGGACGGLFVTLVANNCFNDYYEWFFCLVAGLGIGLIILASSVPTTGKYYMKCDIIKVAIFGVMFMAFGSAIYVWQDPFYIMRSPSADFSASLLRQNRNFYGAVSVEDLVHRSDPRQNYRVFFSGQIVHGMQFTHPDRQTTPASYHSIGSGVGQTLEYAKSKYPSLRVAVVGLGAGTLANYARELDQYDFYEINPEVISIAQENFDNLRLCKAKKWCTILGDARLKIGQSADDVLYDMIILDAFSGGSVPIHLLTKEAFAIYRKHLKKDGFIVANITNGYLNLYPVLKRQAEYLGMNFRYKSQAPAPSQRIRRSKYFIMTEDKEYISNYPSENSKYYDANGEFIGEENPEIPGVSLWSDHFSSINAIELRE